MTLLKKKNSQEGCLLPPPVCQMARGLNVYGSESYPREGGGINFVDTFPLLSSFVYI